MDTDIDIDTAYTAGTDSTNVPISTNTTAGESVNVSITRNIIGPEKTNVSTTTHTASFDAALCCYACNGVGSMSCVAMAGSLNVSTVPLR